MNKIPDWINVGLATLTVVAGLVGVYLGLNDKIAEERTKRAILETEVSTLLETEEKINEKVIKIEKELSLVSSEQRYQTKVQEDLSKSINNLTDAVHKLHSSWLQGQKPE